MKKTANETRKRIKEAIVDCDISIREYKAYGDNPQLVRIIQNREAYKAALSDILGYMNGGPDFIPRR